MENKIEKAKGWRDYHETYDQYVMKLWEMKGHEVDAGSDLDYDKIVGEWAEYCAVNKTYILGGFRGEKDDAGKQMMHLLVKKHDILDCYLDIFYYQYKDRNANKTKDFSDLKWYVNNRQNRKNNI